MFLDIPLRRFLLACCAFLLMEGCKTTPHQGALGRAEVWAVPLQRQALDTHQQVAEELEVFEAEIQ